MTLDRFINNVKRKTKDRNMEKSMENKEIYTYSYTEGNIENKEEHKSKEIDMESEGQVYMLISANYSSKENKPYLLFYDVKNHSILKWFDDTDHHPYAYSKESIDNLEKHPAIIEGMSKYKIIGIKTEEKVDPLLDKKIKVSKIVVRDPLVIGGRADSLREHIKLWEADIKYYINYVMDLGLEIGSYYKFDSQGKPRRFYYPPSEEIKEAMKEISEEERKWLERLAEPVAELKRVALDIEVYNPKGVMPQPENPEYPIFIISLCGSDGLKKVLVYNLRGDIKEEDIEFDKFEVEVFEDEISLIRRALDIIRDYPILITFNGDSFDLPYILARSKRLGFMEVGDYIERGKNEFRISWGIHIDLYKFFKNVSIKTYAFSGAYDVISLGSIARALINKDKKELPGYFDDLPMKDIIEYGYNDAEITLELTQFNDNLVMKLIVIISRISNMTIDDVTRLSVSNWIRNRIFYLHRIKNYLIPRPDEIREKKWVRHFQPVTKGKKYVGALVIDPKPGIHFNVVVVDFASLYPSILKEYNISYETVNCPHKECMSNLVPETTTWICSRKKGLISEFAGIIRDIRVNVFKRLSKDENIPKAQREFYGVIQRALKVIINALYGVIGADTFQFYYLPAAEAVTLYGRYVIKKAIEKADEMGLEVIYGDTDSLFIKNPDVEKLDNLVTYIKDRYRLQLEIDKIYKYTVLSSRKKNYFGITDNGIVDIKGLMGKKSNTPPYIRDIFYQILDKLRTVEDIGQFKVVKNDIIKIINEAESKLISKDIPLEELVITVTLSKKTDQYTKTTPQHVKAARMLERALGIKLQPGHMIRIIKTKNSEGVAPIELVKSLDQVDSKKYIELLHSTLEQILEVLEIKVNRRRKIATIDENRMSLDKFFKF